MPYIKQERRKPISKIIDELFSKKTIPEISTVGELNFAMTYMAKKFVKQNGNNYSTLNGVVGVFESAKLEFYRKDVATYEDEKIKENGDVKINL